MTSPDEVERRLLETAREYLEPDETAQSRIRGLLAARLLQTSSAVDPANLDTSGESGADPPPANPTGAPLDPATSAAAPQFGWLKILVATTIGGGVGFGAGYQVGQQALPSQPPATQLVPPGSEEPAPIDAQPAEGVPELGEPATPRSQVPVPAQRTDERELAADPSKQGDALYRELSLVRRAEQAIRNGEPLLALGLLRELDETFPDGRLKEEREAARTMALCQRELDDEARASAQAFEAVHPNSVYTGRVRELCRFPREE